MNRRPNPPQSVPRTGAAVSRGEPPRPGRPARGSRRGGLLAVLLGVGGFLALLASRRGGGDLYWNKWLLAELARGVDGLPAWAPGAIRDIAAFGSPAGLAVVAGALFLAVAAREGLGPAIGVPLVLGLVAALAGLLKLPFVSPGSLAPGMTAQVLETGFPSAIALFAGVLWARLFRMLGPGALLPGIGWLLAGAICAARASLGEHVPSDVAAGLAAALVVLGMLGWADRAPEPDRRAG